VIISFKYELYLSGVLFLASWDQIPFLLFPDAMKSFRLYELKEVRFEYNPAESSGYSAHLENQMTESFNVKAGFNHIAALFLVLMIAQAEVARGCSLNIIATLTSRQGSMP